MRKCESVGGSWWVKAIMLCIYGRDLTGRVLSRCSPRGVTFGEVGVAVQAPQRRLWSLLNLGG